MPIHSCAVFCGSRDGASPLFAQAADALGAALAQAGITLVYGGGQTGLMGRVCEAALAQKGEVIGIIPEFLRAREIVREVTFPLEITDDIRTRKARMFALSDAFIVLPGGLGTFDELMEALSWKQIDLHHKPIYLLNVGNWAASLLKTFEDTVAQGFADASILTLVETVPDVPALMAHLTR